MTRSQLTALWRRPQQLIASRVGVAIQVRIVAYAVGIAQSIVVARVGGPEVRGIGAAYFASLVLAYEIVSLDLVQQYVRRARAAARPYVFTSYLLKGWALYAAVAVPIGMIVFLGDGAFPWLVAGTIAYMWGAQGLVGSAAFRGPVAGSTVALVQQLSLLAGVAAFALWGTLDGTAIKAVYIIGYLLPLAYTLPMMPRRGDRFPPQTSSASKAPPTGASASTSPVARLRDLPALAAQGGHWQLAKVFEILILQGGVFLVAWHSGDAAAGIYATGAKLAMLTLIVSSQFAADALFRATTRGEDRLRRDATRGVVATAAMSLALAVVAAPLIRIAYGEEFLGAIPVTLMLLPGAIAWASYQVSNQLVRIFGRPWQAISYTGAGATVLALTALVSTATDEVLVVAGGVTLAMIVAAGASYVVAARDAKRRALRADAEEEPAPELPG